MKGRLQSILAHAGIASRRASAKLIEEGSVSVNGEVIREKGFRVDTHNSKILINGLNLPKQEKKYYFLFNKPPDVISTVSDTHGRKKITDFFKNIPARLYPVGRLDRLTRGIIIVTNDGELAQKLSHPKFEIEKEYIARVEPCVSGKDVKNLENGILLDGKNTSPCKINLIEKTRDTAVYRIKLHEGRKRQIRRMFETKGVKVIELERVEYAGLTLGTLKPGEFRPLTIREIKRLCGGF